MIQKSITSEIKHEKKKWEIVNYILIKKKVKGKDIAKHFNLKPEQVRKYIQLIRENIEMFFNPTNKLYLVADNQGYYFTNKPRELIHYYNMLSLQIVSKRKQSEQLRIIMNQHPEIP